eukprot:3688000-Prymnesium_polylepis.1
MLPDDAPTTPSWPARFEVTHEYINVRVAPSLTGRLLGMKKRGALVEADAVNDGWLRLTERIDGETGWLLADGRKVPGLPPALVRAWMPSPQQPAFPPRPAVAPPAAAAAEDVAVEAARLES